MPRDVYVASVGLTKVDLTGKIFSSIFDLFAQAYHSALEHSEIRSFDAVQIGIMDSEEFENRANIAAKVVDRIGLTGVPAVRTETASSTGAAAFHEACYKIASGEFENVLVIAGERMKSVDLTDEELKTSDLVVVLTDHPDVDYDRVVTVGPRVFDTRNATKDVVNDREKITKL